MLTKRTEEYVYDFFSFVAELGGALGLFLGFSFFMFWDFIVGLFGFLSKFGSVE